MIRNKKKIMKYTVIIILLIILSGCIENKQDVNNQGFDERVRFAKNVINNQNQTIRNHFIDSPYKDTMSEAIVDDQSQIVGVDNQYKDEIDTNIVSMDTDQSNVDNNIGEGLGSDG